MKSNKKLQFNSNCYNFDNSGGPNLFRLHPQKDLGILDSKKQTTNNFFGFWYCEYIFTPSCGKLFYCMVLCF